MLKKASLQLALLAFHYLYPAIRLELSIVSKLYEEGEPILDVGCGRGMMLYDLFRRRMRVIALDISLESIRIARLMTHGHVPIVLASATHLPFRTQSFGQIICLQVLEHVEKDSQALQEMYRVLLPGGSIIISVPNRRFEALRLSRILPSKFVKARNEVLREIGHVREGYSTEETECLCRENGFIIEQHRFAIKWWASMWMDLVYIRGATASPETWPFRFLAILLSPLILLDHLLRGEGTLHIIKVRKI